MGVCLQSVYVGSAWVDSEAVRWSPGGLHLLLPAALQAAGIHHRYLFHAAYWLYTLYVVMNLSFHVVLLIILLNHIYHKQSKTCRKQHRKTNFNRTHPGFLQLFWNMMLECRCRHFALPPPFAQPCTQASSSSSSTSSSRAVPSWGSASTRLTSSGPICPPTCSWRSAATPCWADGSVHTPRLCIVLTHPVIAGSIVCF